MKKISLKSVILMLLISGITFISLTNCGQGKNEKEADVLVDSLKDNEQPVLLADTTSVQPVNPAIDKKADTVIQKDNAQIKKEIISADKKKDAETAKPVTTKPVITTKKPEPLINTPPPPDQKPINETVKPKDVKDPVPVTPVPDPPPKKAEDPKPVPVVSTPTEHSDWIVPAKYKNMANPFPADKENLELGKSLYGTHCKSCHGGKGEGNGPKAATIDTKMRSFLDAQVQAQKPGEIYYKTIFGKGDMPKYDKKIPDEEERWAVVNYILSLK